MTAINIIFIMASMYYYFEYKFYKYISNPTSNESDPYYEAIYGTGQFSPEAIKQRKLEQEQLDKAQSDNLMKIDKETSEDEDSLIEYPIEVSSDNEVDFFVEQLQSEFNKPDKESFPAVPKNKTQEDNLEESEQLQMILKNNQLLVDEKGDYLDIAELTMATEQGFPQSSISDDIDEIQQWSVVVVGKEGEYLHVSDGTKKWVYVGDKSKSIEANDYLMLSVIVKNEKIIVKDLSLIEEF